MHRLLVFLGVLIIVLVGVDIGGRAYAQSRASQAIAAQTGTAAPTVTIHGFSFLVQAIPGRYSNITLTSSDITAGPINGISATMQLYDVDFPPGDALQGNTDHLTAGEATVQGVIPDAAVTAAVGQTGATVSAGPAGAIRISSTVSFAGQSIPVNADLVVSFVGGSLQLDATGLSAAGISLPGLADLAKNLSVTLPLEDLPFTVDAATLTSSGSNLILTASANNVRINSRT